ncbi:MAG: response regulator [Planctomycetes bacterium]|nr:response regulator [Planctomycetota bacterium]
MDQTVLFVDDDAALLDGLRRALHRERFHMFTAGSAVEAMDLLEKQRVDVIVSDDHMPGVSGSDFLAQVRLLYPGVIRMMLTGKASLDSAMQAINEGHIFRYLVKPCAVEELVQAVNQGLGQKRLMDRCRQALLLIRRQSALIEHLKRTQPDLLRAAQQETTWLALTPDQVDTVEELSTLMAAGVDRAEDLLPGSLGT